ncbi:MAG: glycerol kinase GlpK [Nitrospinae bacterium]|nr:glycerol kinase GlpK [Nitrospinota bacterium]
MARYILALDQGTTSSRAILFDRSGAPIARCSRPFRQIFPQPGWVEHDPEEIWESQLAAAREVLREGAIDPRQVAAIGVTNQRETTVVWDRRTGRAVGNAIVWQCRRTAPICDQLWAEGWEPRIRERTGLLLDAYFSGPKVRWLLDSLPEGQRRAEAGELAFGTVDSWLLYRLTGGQVHVTDYSNASRTLLFDITRLRWEPEILQRLDLPEALLPEVRSSSEVYGYTEASLFGLPIPIGGIAGDQQAALFGQGCFDPGMAKNTYGTGCFLLMNTGPQPIRPSGGLLTTLAWGINGTVEYALEGSVFVAGAAIQWLRDQLGILGSAGESEGLACSVPDTGGVYFVPAFVGLGAPHWDMYARGLLIGLTRGTTRAHIVRAALESIAYQSRELVACMERDAGVRLSMLRSDGGASANDFLMQFQADLLGVPVERAAVAETTALGAACLAGLAVGFWRDRGELVASRRAGRRFVPQMDEKARVRLIQGWEEAVRRCAGWADRGLQSL